MEGLSRFTAISTMPPKSRRSLDANPGDLASLYGLAVERWGDDTERRIIGEYCAIIADARKLAAAPVAKPASRAPALLFS